MAEPRDCGRGADAQLSDQPLRVPKAERVPNSERVPKAEADGPPAARGAAPAEQLRALYEVPPEQFVARRNDLAKELRAGGAGEQAAEIAALRRPTLAQWAANRLCATAPDDLRRLLDAGADLRTAQLAAAGGDREAARELTLIGARERAALATLARAATALLEESGHGASEATLRVLETTLHTAATGDDALREQLADGRLSGNLQAPGFDDLASVWTAAPPGCGSPGGGVVAGQAGGHAEARTVRYAGALQLRAEAAPAEPPPPAPDARQARLEQEARRDAQRAVVRLRRRVEELGVRARRAQQRAEAARAAAAAADAALTRAQADADAIAVEADQAAAELAVALAKVEDEPR